MTITKRVRWCSQRKRLIEGAAAEKCKERKKKFHVDCMLMDVSFCQGLATELGRHIFAIVLNEIFSCLKLSEVAWIRRLVRDKQEAIAQTH